MPAQLSASTDARDCRRRPQPGGVTMRVNASKLASSASCAARLHDRLCQLALSGASLALRIHGLERVGAVRQFYNSCRELRDVYAKAGIQPRRLELTIGAGSVPLRAAWHIRRSLLGNGVLNVLFDAASFAAGTSSVPRAAIWHDLWQLRSAPVRSAFWPTVNSACTLLSPEQGNNVIPGVGLQAPEQSAWLRAEFDLRHFADHHGAVDMPMLSDAIEGFMKAADRSYDTATWASSAMQHDAWFNRRLAIAICGIGDIVRQRKLDPERHQSLVELRKLLARIRRIVEAQSRALAVNRERLPAIAASDPCLRLPAGSRESCWQRHWHAALERYALGHRNLVVMSPWSLFPVGDADFRYANLLPLLAEADACEFRRQLSLHAWSVPQLKVFHCRAWALNNAALPSAVIADQP